MHAEEISFSKLKLIHFLPENIFKKFGRLKLLDRAFELAFQRID